MTDNTTEDAVHAKIRKKAAYLANEVVNQDETLPIQNCFMDLGDKLILGIQPGMPAEYLDALHAIGIKAMVDAIMEFPEDFAGLIVGAARQGAQYITE